MAELLNGNQQWVDSGGEPLNLGKVYIGDQNADPVTNLKSIFSNRALSSALANPQILSSTGFSTNKIWLSGRYSIRVETAAGVLVKQELDNGEADQVSLSALTSVAGINTITGANTPTITAYVDKAIFIFQVASLNTADAVTLNIDSVGAKAIKRNFDQDVGKGKFKADQTVMVAYNSGKDYFEWVNENARIITQTEGTAIASASTIDLSLATGNALSITGSTGPVTSLGTVIAGVEFTLTFAAGPTLTHNGTSLILPGNEDIIVQAGDVVRFLSLGSGNFICINYQRETGLSVVAPVIRTKQATTSGTAFDFTGIPFGVKQIIISFEGVSLSGTDQLLVQIGDSGGIEVANYISSGGNGTFAGAGGVNSSTAGFILRSNSAVVITTGHMILTRMDDAFLWISSHSKKVSTLSVGVGGGNKVLGARLTQLRLTRTGTDTFDAGSVNIMYS